LIEYPVHETCSASDLRSRLGKSVRAIGYCVTTKDTSTITGALMHFGTFYDYNGEVFDSVHFPDVAARYPFRGRGFYEIKGTVVDDFGVHMIQVSSMEKVPMIHKRPETALAAMT